MPRGRALDALWHERRDAQNARHVPGAKIVPRSARAPYEKSAAI
jgi:hypothetical protein